MTLTEKISNRNFAAFLGINAHIATLFILGAMFIFSGKLPPGVPYPTRSTHHRLPLTKKTPVM